MAELGMERQVDLVNASNGAVSDSTVSRIMTTEDYIPRRDSLVGLAGALRVEPRELVLFVFELGPEPTPQRQLHPLAEEVDRALAPDSPLPQRDRDATADLIDRVLAPVRPLMRRPKSA
jgi:hypothetical protein